MSRPGPFVITVRIAHAEPGPGRPTDTGPRIDPRMPVVARLLGFQVVLADDTGHRALRAWLAQDPDGTPLPALLDRPGDDIWTTQGIPEELREAMATLPAGQRRAVFLHYYAGLPAGQIGDQAGAARVSLHKARRRLREYLTEHRPNLVPRRLMTTVRIASVEHQRRPTHQTQSPSHLVVLIDDAGGRELPIWMLRGDGDRLERLVHAERGGASAPLARTADDLTSRMLRVIGATVTVVEIDELGPEVTAARIALNGPAGPSRSPPGSPTVWPSRSRPARRSEWRTR